MTTLRQTIEATISENLRLQWTDPIGPTPLVDLGRLADALTTALKSALAVEPNDRLLELDWQVMGVINDTGLNAAMQAAGEMPPAPTGDLFFILHPPQPQGVRCVFCNQTYAEFPQRMEQFNDRGDYAHWGCWTDEERSRAKDEALEREEPPEPDEPDYDPAYGGDPVS